MKQLWVITSGVVNSPVLRELKNRHDVAFLTEEEFAESGQTIPASDRVYVAAESSLAVVLDRMEDEAVAETVRILKDKYACRTLLRAIHPDFYFEKVALAGLQRLAVDRKCVVKPARGFFGVGVQVVDEHTDMAEVEKKLVDELAHYRAFYPESVLSQSELIVEQFVEGAEYAVDMFYDSAGTPRFTAFYCHPASKNPEYCHLLYYTSGGTVQLLRGPMTTFFEKLAEHVAVNGLAIHAEFKLDSGRLIPIELNPMRFGGEGLADLTFHAFRVNPYVAFLTENAPDLEALTADDPTYYAWVLGYTPPGQSSTDYRPQRNRFRSLLPGVIADTALNFERHPAFSISYLRTDSYDVVDNILATEFREFFTKRQTLSKTTYEALRRWGIEETIAPGELLWAIGDPGEWFAVLLEGELEVLAESGGVIRVVEVGGIIGELAALDGLPRSAAVRSRTQAHILRIPGAALRELVHVSSDFLEELFWIQVDRLRSMRPPAIATAAPPLASFE